MSLLRDLQVTTFCFVYGQVLAFNIIETLGIRNQSTEYIITVAQTI